MPASNYNWTQTNSRSSAFTLIELLLVVVLIAILAALLLPVLARPKAAGQSALCKSHLHQTGLALQMYTSDHNVYPPGLDHGTSVQAWADLLIPYNPVPWTNIAWQCPTYVAEGGTMDWNVFQTAGKGFGVRASGSYAYNADGIISYKHTGKKYWSTSPPLGLGMLNLKVSDDRVLAPSEMYTVGDSRPAQYANARFTGWIIMQPWILYPFAHTNITEANPPHSQGYNMLFADGHVNLVKRKDYLFPPRNAQHWNRDNQPHPELWAPTNEWAVQN